VEVLPGSDGGAFILKLDASGGYLGRRVVRGSVVINDVAAVSDGSVYAGGYFSGPLSVDGPSALIKREGDTRQSGFLMKMDADLGVSWVSEGMADLWFMQLEPTPDRGVLAVIMQESAPMSLAKIDANQQARWTLPLGGPAAQTQIYDMAAGGGGFVVTGTDSGGNDLDPGPGVTRAPTGAGFLARFRF
jgi:hypothetical protein